MDIRTVQALNRIKIHKTVKKYLTILCYMLIVGGFLLYIFYAVSTTNNKYKVISDYAKNRKEFKTEKIMINPRIRFQYEDDKIYDIKAKSAVHTDEQEATLYDVYATGELGSITAGELKIDEDGNHFVFSKNPVLILNQGGNL